VEPFFFYILKDIFYVTVRVGSQKILLKTKESPLFE